VCVDIAAAATPWDNPVVSKHRERRRSKNESFWSSGDEKWIDLGPPPVFSPSTGEDWLDVPFPDYTFRRGPALSTLHPCSLFQPQHVYI